MTDNGPLPSTLVKHNPMVLMPIVPLCTSLAFDFAPGVVAQVRWLRTVAP